MSELTPTQSKTLEFIKTSVERAGVVPTLREICGFMGYSAIGSAQDIVAALRKKGYIATSDKQAARSLVLTPLARGTERIGSTDVNTFSIPLLGSVPAGLPVEAIEDRVGTIRMSMAMFAKPRPKPDKLYALQASGESMIGAGINDGDWLVIHSQEQAAEGSIVVARVDGDVTVKRLEKDDRGWFLKPENPEFSPIYASESSFVTIGKVLALQRML